MGSVPKVCRQRVQYHECWLSSAKCFVRSVWIGPGGRDFAKRPKKRAPEIVHIGQADNEMEMILYLAESPSPEVNIIFRRPREESLGNPKDNEAYITFYTPRQGIPPKMARNHFRFPLARGGLYQRILLLLRVVNYELSNKVVTVQFGWPMSSWLDRLAIGVMVFNLMKLPRIFPQFNFTISYFRRHATPL